MNAPTEPKNGRRRFLQIGAAAGGGLLVGFILPGCDRKESDRKEAPPEKAVGHAATAVSDRAPGLAPNAFIRIDRQGIVTLVMHKVEMGQGTYTSMPMLIAEELAVDLAKVKLEHAPADNNLYSDPLLGGQVTGGSTSVRGAWKPLREAGAAARAVLVQAAAQTWNVPADSCQVANGVVTHSSGKSLHYGELVDAAAKLQPPKTFALKDPSAYTLIGKRHARLDSPIKADGSAQFGIDAKLPNMGIAAVAASPTIGGRLKSADDAKALAVKGVREVLKIENAVAVVADHMWAAKQALAALAPQWDAGPNAGVSTKTIVADMLAKSKATGAVATDKGNALKELGSGRKVEALYELPFLAHATMEPANCTVDLRADGCDLYVGTQVPSLAQGAAAKVTGLVLEKVKVHNFYLGGGFGRRLEVDYVVQAVAFAKAQAKPGPVKFVWSREEDIQHDMYRPYYVDRIAAKLDDKGYPHAWFHRVTGSSIMARFAPPAVKNGVDPDAVEGAADLQYSIPELRVEYVRHEPPVPTAFWRGVGPTHNVFVVESFLDELAHAAKQDPVAYRRALLDKSPRLLGVLNLAAEKAGWGKPVQQIAGRKVGRGVSAQFAFGSYMCQIADVSVGAEGDVQVHRVVCALDCGQPINPDGIVAQIEGGIVFGATAALWGEINLEGGKVVQSNFSDYRVMRMNETPQVEVHIVASHDDPGGIGEPGTAGIAPALCNAIFAATGQRIRRLPVSASLKKA
ncbi:isoquinoline 1-oxidoreductase beta subunit [Pseudoduganella lurida]|uniref:Isoquinoline 1-oxidoreductase beta subunit n=1 Tax=Pseudoduganella lurida TaxID=1036180 RepID=A0A562RMG4_9BURK|nr:xanthine dehydrogenase family protein molybdopterin-binding subunit [Pseudoduganella lurida]TWI70231.1 isoquinoline 1-oxidoreductase beta subunit [Pseudoduganella lurida]